MTKPGSGVAPNWNVAVFPCFLSLASVVDTCLAVSGSCTTSFLPGCGLWSCRTILSGFWYWAASMTKVVSGPTIIELLPAWLDRYSCISRSTSEIHDEAHLFHA